VNLDQLKTVLWLRWRLTVNQVKRQGKIWAVIIAIIFWLGLIAAVCSFFGALSLGFYLSQKFGPYEWMFLFDAIVMTFLGMWTFGLLIEVQQSELLSLHKLLHLPISLGGTFVCNYLTSLISITLALLVPLLIVTFVFLVSTVTYQFQGWLATMMLNPRRRRTVIATLSLVVILGAQLPNFINLAFQRTMRSNRNSQTAEIAFNQDFHQRVAKGEAKADEYQQQLTAFQEMQTQRQRFQRATLLGRIRSISEAVNAALPVTWLPYGIKAAAEGRVLPGLFGSLGAALISVASLRRSYRTAMSLYTGAVASGSRAIAKPKAPAPNFATTNAARPRNLVERTWPLLSEQAATVAWTNIRSLSRSPEMRLLMIAPLVAPLVIGGLLFAHGSTVPAVFRPLIALSGIAVPMMALVQLLQNQFGADRSGFRATVLTSIPRREILLGKNLSLAPLTIGVGVLILFLMQLILRMPVGHLTALLVQLVATYFAYCITGNMISIWFPAAVVGGSLKPANANTRVILAQVAFGLLFPIVWLPALAMYGIHVLVEAVWFGPNVPTFLLLSLVQLAVTAFLYRWALHWQGKKLQQREQIILQAVTGRPE
jgi:ABC-2 type transport system permease protein